MGWYNFRKRMKMIRRAVEEDIPSIQKLLYQVQEVHAKGRPDLFQIGGYKYTAEQLRAILPDDERPVYVYLDEKEELKGYAFLMYERVEEGSTSLVPHTTLYIDDLCVEENARGQHIGEQLYHFVLEEAKRTGCYRVTLHVWDCNPGAMAFYEKIGLLPVNRTLEQILA